MPTPTHELITAHTLVSTTNSLTFSAIPSTYKDLILVIDANLNTSGTLAMTFNSSSGNNITSVVFSGASTTITAGVVSNQGSVSLVDGNKIGQFSSISRIIDYSSTVKQKAIVTRSNHTGSVTYRLSFWDPTNAIFSLILSTTSGWAAGGKFFLYGVV